MLASVAKIKGKRAAKLNPAGNSSGGVFIAAILIILSIGGVLYAAGKKVENATAGK